MIYTNFIILIQYSIVTCHDVIASHPINDILKENAFEETDLQFSKDKRSLLFTLKKTISQAFPLSPSVSLVQVPPELFGFGPVQK